MLNMFQIAPQIDYPPAFAMEALVFILVLVFLFWSGMPITTIDFDGDPELRKRNINVEDIEGHLRAVFNTGFDQSSHYKGFAHREFWYSFVVLGPFDKLCVRSGCAANRIMCIFGQALPSSPRLAFVPGAHVAGLTIFWEFDPEKRKSLINNIPIHTHALAYRQNSFFLGEKLKKRFLWRQTRGFYQPGLSCIRADGTAMKHA